MKRIISILTTFLIILIGVFIYLNLDKITDYTIHLFKPKQKIILEESNDYKRNFTYKKFNYTEDYIPNSKEDLENIYFNILNNGWINFTFYCPEEYITCLDDVRNMSKDTILVSKINNYVNPFNSFNSIDTTIDENGTITLAIHKAYTENEIEILSKKIDEILTNNIYTNDTDTQKIRKIKNYLVDNIIYDENFQENDRVSPSTRAVGALINNKAVCSGYSDAMALFLDRLNIPNLKVSSENHIWNLVYVDNNWKHLDVTWSDTDTSMDLKEKFFLISAKELLKLDEKEHNFDTMFYMEAN